MNTIEYGWKQVLALRCEKMGDNRLTLDFLGSERLLLLAESRATVVAGSRNNDTFLIRFTVRAHGRSEALDAA